MTDRSTDTDLSSPKEQEGQVLDPTHAPVLTLDYALYAHYLDNADLTDEQKKEFLDALWLMIVSFVDLGFGIHPLQQACAQPLDLSQLELSDVITSKTPTHRDAFSYATKNTDQSGGGE